MGQWNRCLFSAAAYADTISAWAPGIEGAGIQPGFCSLSLVSCAGWRLPRERGRVALQHQFFSPSAQTGAPFKNLCLQGGKGEREEEKKEEEEGCVCMCVCF